MSRKKKEQAVRKELEAIRQARQEFLEGEMKEAVQTPDPAAKVLALMDMHYEAEFMRQGAEMDAARAVKKVYKDNRALAATTAVGLLSLGLGGVLYVEAYTENRETFRGTLEAEAKAELDQTVPGVREQMNEMIGETMERHFDQILQSPLCDDILNNSYLAEKFEKVAARQTTAGKQAAEEALARGARRRLLNRPYEMNFYDRMKVTRLAKQGPKF